MAKGWTSLQNSKKWHYFGEDHRSLCGKFLVLGIRDEDLEEGNNESSDNCAGCMKKLAKESGNG